METPNLRKNIKNVFDLMSQIHFAASMATSLLNRSQGKTTSSVLSKQQQVVFAEHLQKLAVEDVQVVIDFINWHFKENRQRGALGGATAWWYANAFRSFVSKLGPRSLGEDTQTAGAETFLVHIASIIKSEATVEDGYRKVLNYFEAAGVPHLPSSAALTKLEEILGSLPEWTSVIFSVPDQFKNWVTEQNEKIDTRQEERVRKHPILGRFLNWFENHT